MSNLFQRTPEWYQARIGNAYGFQSRGHHPADQDW